MNFAFNRCCQVLESMGTITAKNLRNYTTLESSPMADKFEMKMEYIEQKKE